MLMAATSLSACTKARPSSGMRRDIHSSSSVWGVIGITKIGLQPARMAASAIAIISFSKFTSHVDASYTALG